MAGGWRTLHNEEFVTCTRHQILLKVIKAGHVAWVGKMKCIHFGWKI